MNSVEEGIEFLGVDVVFGFALVSVSVVVVVVVGLGLYVADGISGTCGT